MSYPAPDPSSPIPSAEDRPISPWSTVALYFLNLFFSAIAVPVAGFAGGIIYISFIENEKNSLGILAGGGVIFYLILAILLAGVVAFTLCTLVWLPLWITNHRHYIFDRPLIATLWGALLGLLVLAFVLFPWVLKIHQAPAPPSTPLSGDGKWIGNALIASLAASAAIPGALVFLISSLCHPRRARP